MRHLAVILAINLISGVSVDNAGAQVVDHGMAPASGKEFSLELKNVGRNKIVFLVEGDILEYKLQSSGGFVTGRITGITDSTIIVESRDGRKDTLGQQDLLALRIPKSTRRKAIGHILMVAGAWTLVGVTVNPAEGTTSFLNYLAYIAGLYGVIVGYSIKHQKRINLDDSWSWALREISVIETIERGSFISVVMKNGDVIKEMKVDKVDFVEIQGYEITQDLNEQFVYTHRTIGVSDIETLIVMKR